MLAIPEAARESHTDADRPGGRGGARAHPADRAPRQQPNPIARWANTYKTATEAVEVIAHLVAIERALAALAPVGRPDS